MTSDSLESRLDRGEYRMLVRLPTRKRGAQSAKAKEEYERALSEWCQEIYSDRHEDGFQDRRTRLVLRPSRCWLAD